MTTTSTSTRGLAKARALAIASPLFLALSLSACAASDAKPKSEVLTAKQTKKLDRYLADKTAGEPRKCIHDRGYSTIRVSDRILLYRASGNLVYRNDLKSACRGLARDDDIIVIRKWGGTSSLCSGDLFHLLDRVSGIRGGSCVFGEFTPYKASKAAKQATSEETPKET